MPIALCSKDIHVSKLADKLQISSKMFPVFGLCILYSSTPTNRSGKFIM